MHKHRFHEIFWADLCYIYFSPTEINQLFVLMMKTLIIYLLNMLPFWFRISSHRLVHIVKKPDFWSVYLKLWFKTSFSVCIFIHSLNEHIPPSLTKKVAKWTYWALQFLKYTLTDKIATGKYYTAIFISHLQHELLQKHQVHIYTIKSAVYTKIYNTQDINFQL